MVAGVRGDRVDQPVGADLARIVDQDRYGDAEILADHPGDAAE